MRSLVMPAVVRPSCRWTPFKTARRSVRSAGRIWRSGGPRPREKPDDARPLKILNVWAALGGGELRNRRGRAFWRDGDGYSVTLDEVKNAWYDFRDGMGGGVLSLVETVGGYSRGEALTWLERNCGLDPRRALSPQEKRLYAAQAAGTERLAERLTDFARGLELIAEKTVIDLHGFLGDGYAPEALAPFHRQLFIYQSRAPARRRPPVAERANDGRGSRARWTRTPGRI